MDLQAAEISADRRQVLSGRRFPMRWEISAAMIRKTRLKCRDKKIFNIFNWKQVIFGKFWVNH